MGVAFALALALGVADLAPTPPGESRIVHIDAVASDSHGRSVANLRASDFEIFDETGAHAPESVRFVTADGWGQPGETFGPILSRGDELAEARREGTRLFAFYLDEYHVAPGAPASRVRDALARLIDEQLGPGDLVMVVKPLDSLLNLRVTRDRAAALRALAGFEGRKGHLEPRSAFERNYIAGSPARVEAVRAQIVLSALSAMATHLGGLGTSRKTLVVVSEGFVPAYRRRGDELPALDTVISSANRAKVSVYPIDPRAFAGADLHDQPREQGGDADGQARSPRALLRALADATGGQAILEGVDVASVLRRVVSDSSSYYLLALRSGSDTDGGFHRVAVRVKRQGVELRARSGYWAPVPDTGWQPRVATSAAAIAAAANRRTSPLIRPWFGLARGGEGTTRVSFVWEPATRVPGDRRAAQAARLTMTAVRRDGTAVFEGAVRPTGSRPDRASAPDPLRAVFETPPGRLRIQLAIEDAASRIIDTDVRELTVRAFDGPVALGTAEVLRARSAREYRALVLDLEAAPVVAREFRRAERLLIRVPVSADAPPVVAAKLASKLGGPMRDLAVVPSGQSDLYQCDLPLAGLAPGEYIVELTAKASGGAASDTIAFRVTP